LADGNRLKIGVSMPEGPHDHKDLPSLSCSQSTLHPSHRHNSPRDKTKLIGPTVAINGARGSATILFAQRKFYLYCHMISLRYISPSKKVKDRV